MRDQMHQILSERLKEVSKDTRIQILEDELHDSLCLNNLYRAKIEELKAQLRALTAEPPFDVEEK